MLHRLFLRRRPAILRGAFVLVLLGCLGLGGCRTAEDAAAAASQMTVTASALEGYYRTLAGCVGDDIALYELDAVFSGVPFDSASRQPLEDTRKEIQQRAALAGQLESLGATFTALNGSTAPGDVQNAATALAAEAGQLHPLPGGPVIPELIGKSANLLVQAIQQHKEEEAARAMDATLSALATLFEKERPVYDSIARTGSKQAALVAKDLLDRGRVDLTPMLNPALRPFGLAPVPLDASTSASLSKLAADRLQRSADEALERESAASAAMLAALQEMSSRVHRLATGQTVAERGGPATLQQVESWVHWAAK